MNYALHIVVIGCIYTLLAHSVNITMGYGGMVSLCHAAFAGIGAYTCSIMILALGSPFLIGACIALGCATLVGWMAAFAFSRLRGDFLLLGTLSFQAIVYEVLRNWEGVTRGAYGLTGIPRPALFGFVFSSVIAFSAFAVTVTVIAHLVVRRLLQSPFGRTLKAIRDDPTAAALVRKDNDAFRRTAFAWSAGVAALAGILFACNFSYIDPSSFDLQQSVLLLCVLVIGGAGNTRGPVIGGFLFAALPEVLRFLPLPDQLGAVLRQIIYGLALIIFMRARPTGLSGEYSYDSKST